MENYERDRLMGLYAFSYKVMCSKGQGTRSEKYWRGRVDALEEAMLLLGISQVRALSIELEGRS